jgi:hypothetical protein
MTFATYGVTNSGKTFTMSVSLADELDIRQLDD